MLVLVCTAWLHLLARPDARLDAAWLACLQQRCIRGIAVVIDLDCLEGRQRAALDRFREGDDALAADLIAAKAQPVQLRERTVVDGGAEFRDPAPPLNLVVAQVQLLEVLQLPRGDGGRQAADAHEIVVRNLEDVDFPVLGIAAHAGPLHHQAQLAAGDLLIAEMQLLAVNVGTEMAPRQTLQLAPHITLHCPCHCTSRFIQELSESPELRFLAK
mmetsp:Transcript_4544/g.7631  ORF Transcript_4544/g.7631 Transcript_4544/m.7631 type:complete len:215 (-) Transcript_4544:304-948(-)